MYLLTKCFACENFGDLCMYVKFLEIYIFFREYVICIGRTKLIASPENGKIHLFFNKIILALNFIIDSGN